jgi:hypothetical protein
LAVSAQKGFVVNVAQSPQRPPAHPQLPDFTNDFI